MIFYHLHGKCEEKLCELEAYFPSQPGGVSVYLYLESIFLQLFRNISISHAAKPYVRLIKTVSQHLYFSFESPCTPDMNAIKIEQ